jgi:tagatose 6-phosphate kinase
MIICLGTTPTVQRTMTFERLTLDSVNRATHVHEYASGKSVNAARVLHTLGDDVLATGFVGGERAALFQADLDRSGIAHDFVTVSAPTRLCTTVIDQSAGSATELIEESHAVTWNDASKLLGKLNHASDLIVLSGTLAPGVDEDFYAKCIVPATRVVLDAVGEPLLRALPNRPFVIKPNQSEVGRTLGIDVSSEDALRAAMRQLVDRGAQWVIVTRGRDGTLVTNGRSFWRLNTPAVKVVSAIGSGDSFAGGLASALARGVDVPQACILAAACGSANAITPYSGHVRLEDVDRLSKQITLTPLPPGEAG